MDHTGACGLIGSCGRQLPPLGNYGMTAGVTQNALYTLVLARSSSSRSRLVCENCTQRSTAQHTRETVSRLGPKPSTPGFNTR